MLNRTNTESISVEGLKTGVNPWVSNINKYPFKGTEGTNAPEAKKTMTRLSKIKKMLSVFFYIRDLVYFDSFHKN